MAWRGRPEAGALALLALVLCARGAQGRTLLWHSAVVGLEYVDPRTNRTVRSVSESGRFGDGSPREPRRGLVGVLRAPGGDPGGCAPDMRFLAPAALAPWVALVARGDCPLRGLALAAARGNASALVVYGEEEEEKRGEHLAASPAHAGERGRWAGLESGGTEGGPGGGARVLLSGLSGDPELSRKT